MSDEKQQNSLNQSTNSTTKVPLLPKQQESPVISDQDAMFNPQNTPPSSGLLMKTFLRIAIPSIVTNLLGFASIVTQTVFAGTLTDPINLAVVGLAGTFCAIMVLSLMIGLNSAQETLTSQAFGAGNLRLCGVYLNRGHFILIAFFIPLAIIPACFAENIFLLIGQDPEVSRLTARQVQFLLPSIFFYSHYDLQKRWMACQRITFYPMVAMMIATVLHVPLCLIFFRGFDMGIVGLAIATSIKDAILLMAVMVYACCSSQISHTLQRVDSDAFKGWGQYLKVSLPTTIMMCSEWWAFEILTVIAGTLGVTELACQIIIMNMAATLFMVPLGIQEATCGIIGNCIGANNVPLAKRFFNMINVFTFVCIAVMCMTIGLARHHIVDMFTNDEEVRRVTSNVVILLSSFFIFDGMQGYLQGPIRAMGLQQKASYSAIACYYGIGLPMACLFVFKFDMGVMGLQAGVAGAVFVQFCCYLMILLWQDWQNVADQAVLRIEKEARELEELRKQMIEQSKAVNDDSYEKAQ